jgi:hypothetical protein
MRLDSIWIYLSISYSDSVISTACYSYSSKMLFVIENHKHNPKKHPAASACSPKQRAKQHGRNLNKEALACLEKAVAPSKVNINALLLDIRSHRASLPGRLNDRLIQTAKAEGRP